MVRDNRQTSTSKIHDTDTATDCTDVRLDRFGSPDTSFHKK